MVDQRPSFEDVLEEMGVFGRFQKTQMSMIFCSKLIVAFMTLSYVFLGYEPSHVCNSVNETSLLMNYGLLNDSSAVIGYHSCDVTISTNRSGRVHQVTKMACPNGRNFSDARGTTLLSEFDLVCESSGKAELSQTIFVLGSILGGLIASPLSDHFGRKPVLVISSFSVLIIEGVTVFAPDIYIIYLLRIVSGFVYHGVVCTYFIIGIEMLVPRHRQIFGVVFCVVWIAYLLMLGGVAYALQNYSWRYLQGTIAALGLLSVLYPFILQESSRWLAVKNLKERALKVLKKASKQNGTNFELVQQRIEKYWSYNNPSEKNRNVQEQTDDFLQMEVDTKKETVSIFTLICNRRLLWLTFLTWFIWTTNNVTYYGLFMTSSDMTGNRFLNFTLMGLVEIPSNVAILVMMNKMKRKTVLMFFLIMAAASLMTSSLFITFSDDSWTSGVISTILFIVGKFAIGSSFNVIYIMTPEMYPTNLRSFGNGINSSGSKVGSMLAPFSRPLFQIAKWAPGLIFTVMCIISVFMVMGLPETKDRNLPNDLGDLEKMTTDSSTDDGDNEENECLESKDDTL